MYYTSIQAAEKIGTTPRMLRRFIRQNDSWHACGNGGRYMFSDAEVKSLEVQFNKWRQSISPIKSPARPRTEEPLSYLDIDKGIDPQDLSRMSTDYRFKEQVLKNRRLRQIKLQTRMLEVGVGTHPELVDVD